MFATCKLFLAIRSSNPIASLHLWGTRSWNSTTTQFQLSLLWEHIGEFGHIFFFITKKGGGQKLGCEASGKGSKFKSNNNNREVGSSSSWLDIITTNNASFVVHCEVMWGCAGVGVVVDEKGWWHSDVHHVGTTFCARA
jgi:hypothetical protein